MRRLSLAPLALSLLCALGAAILVSSRRDAVAANSQAHLAEVAQTRAGQLLGYFEEMRSGLTLAATSPAAQLAAADIHRTSDAQLEAQLVGLTPAGGTAFVIDRHGVGKTVITAAGGRSRPLSDRLVATLQSAVPPVVGDISAVGPLHSTLSGQPVIDFLVRCEISDSALIGIEVPVDRLGLIADSDNRPSPQIVVADLTQHRIVFHTAHATLTTSLRDHLLANSSVDGLGLAQLQFGRMTAAVDDWSQLQLPYGGVLGNLEVAAVDPHGVPELTQSFTPASIGLGGAAVVLLLLYLAYVALGARRLDRLANTDPLTGLGNRRLLMHDLAPASGDRRGRALALLDLDGFKLYNDTFGHDAGDNLLERLGGKLAEAADLHAARAYRLGGDEFCVLCEAAGDTDVEVVRRWSSAALAEEGPGFAITASCGVIRLPHEARSPADALRLADERMYAQKKSGRTSPAFQITSVVGALLKECIPFREVEYLRAADVVERIGRALVLSDERVTRLRRATLLYPLGFIAIPDAILNKAAPLTGEERAFVESHTEIAARVLKCTPALQAEGLLLRAVKGPLSPADVSDSEQRAEFTHDARILAMTVAYCALRAARNYRPARDHAQALQVLRHEFADAVDERSLAVFDREGARPAPAAAQPHPALDASDEVALRV